MTLRLICLLIVTLLFCAGARAAQPPDVLKACQKLAHQQGIDACTRLIPYSTGQELTVPYTLRGSRLSDLGKCDAAIKDFDEAMRWAIPPGGKIDLGTRQLLYTIHLRRSSALSRCAGDLSAAIRELDEAITLKPGDAAAYANKSYALTEQKRFAEAIEVAKKSLQLKKDYDIAYSALGEAYKQSSEFDQAVSA